MTLTWEEMECVPTGFLKSYHIYFSAVKRLIASKIKVDCGGVDTAVCVRALQKTPHTALDCSANNPERLLCSPCAFGQSLYESLNDTLTIGR